MALNSQQLAFKEAYIDPESETFGNAKRSAIVAGYSEEYADTITASGQNSWFSEILGDLQRLQKSEKRLEEALDFPMTKPEEINAVSKVAMFIAETIGKHKYSKRTELTDKDGKKLFPTPILQGLKVEE